jgi:hypothetical protein
MPSDDSLIWSNDESSLQEEKFLKRYLNELEDERQIFLEKWKAESARFRTRTRRRNGESPGNEGVPPIWNRYLPSSILENAEVFLSIMPLTIGAVGLSWVTMGVVWFKFMEEMNVQDNVCVPYIFVPSYVHIPSSQDAFNAIRTINPTKLRSGSIIYVILSGLFAAYFSS